MYHKFRKWDIFCFVYLWHCYIEYCAWNGDCLDCCYDFVFGFRVFGADTSVSLFDFYCAYTLVVYFGVFICVLLYGRSQESQSAGSSVCHSRYYPEIGWITMFYMFPEHYARWASDRATMFIETCVSWQMYIRMGGTKANMSNVQAWSFTMKYIPLSSILI